MDIIAAITCAEMIVNQLLDSSSSSDEEEMCNIFTRSGQSRVKGFFVL